MLEITILPILDDNYCYILKAESTIAILDPGDADPVIHHLETNSLKPTFILNTHHHWDHTNGNQKIKDKYNCRIIGPASEKSKIKNIDQGLKHADTFQLGNETITVIEVAGHTAGHICFYAPSSNALFSGDALFSLGCGRLFEGSAKELFQGFQHLKSLPDNTEIYCGHEYTLENSKFCLAQDPNNQALIERVDNVKKSRDEGKFTIPTTLAQEKETNVFLRANDASALQKLRDLKDNS